MPKPRELQTKFSTVVWIQEIQENIPVTIEFEVTAQPSGRPSDFDSFAEGVEMVPEFLGAVWDTKNVEYSDKDHLMKILHDNYCDELKDIMKDYFYESFIDDCEF